MVQTYASYEVEVLRADQSSSRLIKGMGNAERGLPQLQSRQYLDSMLLLGENTCSRHCPIG